MAVAQQLATFWCGTLNNYTEEEEKRMQEFMTNNCKYAIYGREVAPTTGTKHLQCFWSMKTHCRGSKIINAFPGIHIEKCMGTEEQNVQYCRKEGDFWETGKPQKQTQKYLDRNKRVLDITRDYMAMPYHEFAEVHPWEAYHEKGKLEQWRIDHLTLMEPYNGELNQKNWWVWGPPGTGKSRWARKQGNEETIYLKQANKWWGGYIDNKHSIILFEDFPNDAKYLGNLMKVWADRYTFTAEVKGGTIIINPANWHLIVTSNYSLDECFEERDAQALRRRFSEVEIKGPNDIFLTTYLA